MTIDTSTPILRMEGVTKSYGDLTAIEATELTIYPGEAIALVGPNGAGKTSILHMCAGILAPTYGTLSVLGYTWGAGTPAAPSRASIPPQLWRMRKQIGFIHADHEVVDRITAREYLAFHAALHEIPKPESVQSIERWLSFFGLTSAADRMLGTYSHGMRKKAQIAAALIHRPRLLICDEPTSGLDPEVIAMMRELFTTLSKQGTTLLVATHDLAFAERIAHRFTFIHRAKIIATGTLDELRLKYQAQSLEEVFLQAIGATQWGEDLRELVAGYRS